MASECSEVNQGLLIDAVRSGRAARVSSLLSRGVSPDVRDSEDMPAIHLAAHKGNVGIVRLLLDAGANLDKATEDGATPLHVAAQDNHSTVIALLLRRGARRSARDAHGMLPLHYAALHGGLRSVEQLAGNGAAVDAVDEYGSTPFICACLHAVGENDTSVLAYLIDNGANVNARRTHDGCSGSMLVARDKYVLEYLIKMGANVHVKDNEGNSLLHYAVWATREDSIQVLLAHGIDATSENSEGVTPLMICETLGWGTGIDLLMSARRTAQQ